MSDALWYPIEGESNAIKVNLGYDLGNMWPDAEVAERLGMGQRRDWARVEWRDGALYVDGARQARYLDRNRRQNYQNTVLGSDLLRDHMGHAWGRQLHPNVMLGAIAARVLPVSFARGARGEFYTLLTWGLVFRRGDSLRIPSFYLDVGWEYGLVAMDRPLGSDYPSVMASDEL